RMPSTFTIVFPLGVTVGKWTRVFEQRHPEVQLIVSRVADADQREAIDTGVADMAFVRGPVDTDGLHLIPLYAEDVVVAMHHEHLLTLEKKLHLADLEGQPLLDGVPSEAMFRSIAAGDGIAVMPQSVAKALRRKDVVTMRLEDAEQSSVGLAWPRDAQHELVNEFIGIVRGRSAHSSRNPDVAAAQADAAKDKPTRPARSPNGPASKQSKRPTGAPRRPPRRGGGRRSH
ncbi:MAG: LysR family transcriptional regulator substrate-binding protein, partial [Leifsonia sp.]